MMLYYYYYTVSGIRIVLQYEYINKYSKKNRGFWTKIVFYQKSAYAY